MLDERHLSPRARRHETIRAEIVAAAWDQCRRNGLTSLSLRELAAAVGMRAPSLYSYFESKDAIYDAMFRDGQEALAAAMDGVGEERPTTRASLRAGMRVWAEFCVSDPVRYQLLFQRVVPGFTPSAASYELAVRSLGQLTTILSEIGVDDPAHVDLFTALVSGLISQQLANDPGGDRWLRTLDDAIDMYLDHVGALPERNQP